jgi:hypothetical protein
MDGCPGKLTCNSPWIHGNSLRRTIEALKKRHLKFLKIDKMTKKYSKLYEKDYEDK